MSEQMQESLSQLLGVATDALKNIPVAYEQLIHEYAVWKTLDNVMWLGAGAAILAIPAFVFFAIYPVIEVEKPTRVWKRIIIILGILAAVSTITAIACGTVHPLVAPNIDLIMHASKR